MIYILVDIGCIECGESSDIVGLYSTLELAEKAASIASNKQANDWHGQHSFEVFEHSGEIQNV